MKFRDWLNEQYGVVGVVSRVGVGHSRSGSQGQRASNVALVCPQCGDLEGVPQAHDHSELKKGDKCPICGQIIESRLDELLNVWVVTTNKRKITVMAANKSHAEIQGEDQLKKGETIKKVEMPRK